MAGIAKRPAVPSKKPAVERRRNPRYAVHYDALFCNQEHFAEIIDISQSGIACHFLVESDVFSNVLTSIDLLDCNAGRYVQGLSCRRVRRAVPNPIPQHGRYHTRDCCFEFVNVSETQREEIDSFIRSCSDIGGKARSQP